MPNMSNWFKTRWQHTKAIGKTWWFLLPASWAAFWGLDAAIEKWDLFGVKWWWDANTTHLPNHWQAWLVVLLMAVMVFLIEGSYRHHREILALAKTESTGLEETIGLLKEKLRLEKEKNLTSVPDFIPMIRTVAVIHIPQENVTLIMFQVEIVNKGADSFALITGHYESPTLDADTNLPNFMVKQSWPIPDHPGQYLIIEPDEWLTPRVRKSRIARGELASGRVVLAVPGNKLYEIRMGEAKITLKVQDYLGKAYSDSYQADPKMGGQGGPFMIYPGDVVKPQP